MEKETIDESKINNAITAIKQLTNAKKESKQTKKSAVLKMKAEIFEARKKGVSYVEIAKALTGAGIEITGVHLSNIIKTQEKTPDKKIKTNNPPKQNKENPKQETQKTVQPYTYPAPGMNRIIPDHDDL